jgi:hypothetical protein
MAYIQLFNGAPSNLTAQSVIIPAGTAVSEVLCTEGKAVVGLIMPAAWTAASIGYKTCLSGAPVELVPVYDSGGNPITTVVAASRHVAFPQTDAIFAPYIQFASVTDKTVTAVNQIAAATIIVLLRKYLN